jgi:predicted RNA-binding protein associated with RNAse of E/G family
LRTTIVTGVLAGALLVGGTGAALIVPSLASAADPTASPSTTTQGTTPPTTGTPNGDPGRGPRMGGLEAVSDASVVAGAIGISEADLSTALQGGSTIAAVAKAHNVDVQKVIDALVADKKDELAAAVKAGTITQAQADGELANVTAFATDQVNGSGFGPGGRGGHGGMGGRVEAVTDASVVAKAIGISEADLTTALQGGSTIAAVARAHAVDVQVVIDALVADARDELAAAVKAGTLTQAQADAQASNLTQFATDQVNGSGFGPGGHGMDGRGPGGPGPNGNGGSQAPAAKPTTNG